MNRLRRKNHDSRFQPVAAEVLEVRSLLSASVHAAVAHAQHEVHGAAKPAAPVVVFPGTYNAVFHMQATIQGQQFSNDELFFDGTFHGASAGALAGKKVKIGINEPAINLGPGNLTLNSVIGTIQGKVLSFIDIGSGKHELVIAPSGHLAVTVASGGHTAKATVSANPANHILLDVTGSGTPADPYRFAQLVATYDVTKPTGAVGTVTFTISKP